jgi:DNA-binding transcriptional LysR family regulator
MRYRHVDLNLLLVFHELMQNGSVLRASKSLGVTQGAVSQALAKLRKHFGDELFIKTNVGVAPTTMALSLAEDVRQSIAFAESALMSRARFEPSDSTRDIKICMGGMGELRILPRMLQVFAELAPRCRIGVLDLWGEELKEAFERGAVDLAINACVPDIAHLLQQRLFDDPYVVLMSKDNPLDHDMTTEQLSAARHVVVCPARFDAPKIDQQLEAAGIKRNVAVRVSNWVTVPHLLQTQPDLVAIAPGFLAAAYRQFDLKVLKPKLGLPRVEVYQFWHRRTSSDPFSIWLSARVRDMFGPPPLDAAEKPTRHLVRMPNTGLS